MAQKRSLYEILGIEPDANELDVNLAYERNKLAIARGDGKDANAAALVQQAYEILSNPKRRAAYDAAQVTAAERQAAAAQASAPDLVVESDAVESPARPNWIMPGVLAVVILIVVGFFVLRPGHAPEKAAAEAPPPAPKPEAPPPPQPLKPAQLLEAALRASGQLLRYDMSGTGVPIGMAVSLEPGSVVTTCHGIAAGSKVVFRQGADTLSAELTVDDEILDLCKLAVPGIAPRTLAVAADEAKAGDKVYALGVNAKGEPALTEGKVRGVKMAESVKVLDLDVPIAATGSGAPVLNEFGKVVGIASTPHRYGAGVNAAISSAWLTQMRSRAKAAS